MCIPFKNKIITKRKALIDNIVLYEVLSMCQTLVYLSKVHKNCGLIYVTRYLLSYQIFRKLCVYKEKSKSACRNL